MASYVLDSMTAAEAEAAVFGNNSVVVSPGPARVPRPITAAPRRVAKARVRRRISPVSGHALEKLGHAIEYLTDEYIHEGCIGGLWSARLASIQLLMALNRDVYYACPVVESPWHRLRSALQQSLGV